MKYSEEMMVTPTQAVDLVKDALSVNLVPMLHGSPAIGKSSILHKLAKELDLTIIDARMAGFDPTDLNGFPMADHDKGIARYLPLELFPLDDWEVPEGSNGWLIFLDEFNSAPPSVQAAAYKLVLDRQLGNRNLHKQAYIVAAGNLDSDNAITNPMSSAMLSRLANIVVRPDVRNWIMWANENGISSRIVSFLEFKQDAFYTFDNEEPDQVYSSPRTWEAANRLFMKYGEQIPAKKIPLMSGIIGEGVTQNFNSFIKYYSDMPDIQAIIDRPEQAPIPSVPGVLFALDGALADRIDETNVDAILKYVERLGVEHQIITLRTAIQRNKKAGSMQQIRDWAVRNASEMMG